MARRVAARAKRAGRRHALGAVEPAGSQASSIIAPFEDLSGEQGYRLPAYSTTKDIPHPREGEVVWVSDVHYRHANQRAMDIVLKHLQRARPHTLIVGGDYFDAYSVSKYGVDPDRAMEGLQGEFDAGRPFLIEACKYAKYVHFIEGNHEARIANVVIENSGLHGLRAINFHTLAGLPKKIAHYPFLTKLRQGDLYWHHGQIASQNTAKATFAKFGKSMVCGHTHRPDMHVLGDTMTGDVYQVLISGHMCDIKYARYVDYPGWATGFASALFWPGKDGRPRYNLRQHLILDNSVCIDGVTYRG